MKLSVELFVDDKTYNLTISNSEIEHWILPHKNQLISHGGEIRQEWNSMVNFKWKIYCSNYLCFGVALGIQAPGGLGTSVL